MKHNFVIFCSFLTQFYFIFSNSHPPLVLQRTQGRFHISIRYESTSLFSISTITGKAKMYYFCPAPARTELMPLSFHKRNKYNLYFINSEKTEDSPYCQEPYKYTIYSITISYGFKIDHVYEIKQYALGYKIHTSNTRKSAFFSCFNCDSKTEPNSLYQVDDEFELVSALWIFFNVNLKRVQAVHYEVYPVEPYSQYWKVFPNDYKATKFLDTSHLEIYPGDNSPLEVTLLQSDYNDRDIKSRTLQLYLTPLAPPNHYSKRDLPRIKSNLTPIWSEFQNSVLRINKYLNYISQQLGFLTITSGITIKNSASYQVINRPEIEFVVPEYLWKIVEFTKSNKKYGIILVLRNSLLDIGLKLCEDVCTQHHWMIQDESEDESVYCCDVNSFILEKLKFTYINYGSMKPFNLNKLGFKEKKIKDT